MKSNKLKVNKSQIARELNVDVRTVSKYLAGYEKPVTRNKGSKIDEYDEIIRELLSSKTQIFYYRRVLYQYLVDNHGFNYPEITLRHYLKKHNELDAYFKRGRSSNVSNKPVIRFETDKGVQCQLDWKESVSFVLKDTGETVVFNIFVLILSYSRFRYYGLSIHKTQDVLFNHLVNAFEAFGGVPHEMLTDNMATVMDEARTNTYHGDINKKFLEFSKQFNFAVRPCVAASPETKSKVESPMRILDEIRAYSGKLTYVELNDKLLEINNRVNNKINDGTGRIPFQDYEKEKGFLHPLPHETVRNQYKIKTISTKVNTASMIVFNKCQYSVPPKYLHETVEYQVYDSRIYVYSNTRLIACHTITQKKLNYDSEHYKAILAINFRNKDSESIADMAKNNLKLIGERYDN